MRSFDANRNPPQKYEMIGELVGIFQRGNTWHANYQHDGRQRRRSLRTQSKKEARRRAAKIEAELLNGDHRPALKAPTIESLTADYLAYLRTEGRAEKTLVKYESVFDRVVALAGRRHRRNALGLDLSFVDAYRQERVDAGRAPKTVYTETVIIRQLVNFAITRKKISRDPLEGLKIREPKPTPQPCWTRDEVERILTASQGTQRTAFILLADSGMRVGELKWLTWDDVDFEREVLHIRVKDGWKPKSGDARTVPMSPRVKELLAGLSRRGPWVVRAATSRKYPRGDHQISERRLLKSLKRVLKPLGLAGHLHTFRHGFISHALTSGIPEAIVRDWVGHVDDAVIRLYTHVADEESQRAMARLAEARTVPEPEAEEVDDAPVSEETKSAQIQHNGERAKSRRRAS